MKLLYTILLLLASHIAHSQTGEIYGIVLNEKKQPIIGAEVQVLKGSILKGSANTGFDGDYLIKPLDPGMYQVIVNYIEYAKYTVNDIAIGNRRVEQNINMRRATDSLKEITIKWKKPLNVIRQPILSACEPVNRTTQISELDIILLDKILLAGTITDRHKRPLSGSIIQQYKCGILAESYTTDSSGAYVMHEKICMTTLSRPAYITITCPGYKPRKIEIPKLKKPEKNFTLRRERWQSKK